MSSIEDDFTQLQGKSGCDVESWLDMRFPNGATVQWWCSVLESVENRVSRFSGATTEQLLRRFALGVRMVELAVKRNDILPTLGSYWLLRLSASTDHMDCRIGELPERATPDGAAGWALARMPLTRDEAESYANRRAEEFAEAGKVLYASPGITDREFGAIREDILLLQEVERVLTALSWVRDRVADPRVRAEVDAWLNTGNNFR
ncbi:hypothetical protein ACGF3K_34780 [Streptomyces sp. NPDC047980]|uniref:hypothetical protein n=1 Tax=Streptomyces sp. NPDC047980 TaxID=3365494 RepID=UPI00371DB192